MAAVHLVRADRLRVGDVVFMPERQVVTCVSPIADRAMTGPRVIPAVGLEFEPGPPVVVRTTYWMRKA